MARALLPSLLLLVLAAHVHTSYGSRSPPGEPQKPEEVLPPVVRGAAEPRRRDDGTPSTEEGATAHRGADAHGADASSALGRAGVGSAQRDGRAVVLSQKLARRLLQGGGAAAADSAAGSSCRSHDAHVTCPPPALLH